mmetsp:Transcript_49064/g.116751  ORF Transcript_49064/g.116751 Transcript_49064/m.116751 type:complete len:1024 (+) Transcript_49064:68-3139(+)
MASIPVVPLIGECGSGRSSVASAMFGLPLTNDIFKIGHGVESGTSAAKVYSGHWFGNPSEEEVTVVDSAVRDPAHAGNFLRVIRDLGYLNALGLVLNSEQPRLSVATLELLKLLEEALGRGMWRHVILIFTRWYTDDRSCRRRKTSTEKLREEWSEALLKAFPALAAARPTEDKLVPSYFVDSEAILDSDADRAEKEAALKELRRCSAQVRSLPRFPTAVPLQSGTIPAAATPTAVRELATTGSSWANTAGSSRAESAAVSRPRAGERVSVDNIYVGALVLPGSSWRWKGQASVDSLGEVLDWSSSTQWGTVLFWDLGKQNRYRIGKDGAWDLKFAALNAGEEHQRGLEDALTALQSPLGKGKAGDLNARHLKRTFGYVCGVLKAHFSRFDIREEVCMAVGGFKHGQVVRIGQEQLATTIGVKPAAEGKLRLWFHIDGKPGAGCFDGDVTAKATGAFKVVHEQSRQANMDSSDAEDNEEITDLLATLQPTFGYMRGLVAPEYGLFDVRDEVCLRVGGFRHGDVLRIGGLAGIGGSLGVVVGVALDDKRQPKLWTHLDEKTGAGVSTRAEYYQAEKVGSRQLEAMSIDDPVFSDEPENAAELRFLARSVQPTFGYPTGTLGNVHYEEYDVRDHICERVGGFKHGQVVLDPAGKEAVVIGVRVEDASDLPVLYFHQDGAPGAGRYPRLHTIRPLMKVLREQDVTQVLECDPMFGKQSESDSDGGQLGGLHGLLRQLQEGQQRQQQQEESDADGADTGDLHTLLRLLAERAADTDSDCEGIELDTTFKYPSGQGGLPDFELFDVREDTCLRVGGFKHGQLLKDIDGEELHVIGVRLDKRGKPRFFVHGQRDGTALALRSEHLQALQGRGDGCVIGSRPVQTFKAYGPMLEPLQPTFSYPVGVRFAHKVGNFDIRDEVCLSVGGFRHGDVIELEKPARHTSDKVPEMTVIGVLVDTEDGRAKLWTHIQIPTAQGAGLCPDVCEDAAWARRLFKVVRHVLVEEVSEEEFQSRKGSEGVEALVEGCKQQ